MLQQSSARLAIVLLISERPLMQALLNESYVDEALVEGLCPSRHWRRQGRAPHDAKPDSRVFAVPLGRWTRSTAARPRLFSGGVA